MTNSVRTLLIRDATSFEEVRFLEISSRTLFRKKENELDYTFYEPEYLSLDIVRNRLKTIGQLNNLEQLLCPETLLTITRGWITKEDGKEYYFCLMSENSDKFSSYYVDAFIQSLSLSGKSPRKASIDPVITIKEYPID
tara:strand:+ start:475 stop:891 length:417 start_codon:yes stop_codon:yes gene_type:complete